MDRRTRRLLDAWLDGYRSANTRAAYGRDVADFVAWCDDNGRAPLRATTDDIDRYRDACLVRGASGATVARRLSGVSSFFRFAGRGNPVAEVSRPTSGRVDDGVLDRREIDSLLDAAAAEGPRVEALLGLLAVDGVRLNEALAIDVPQLHGRGRRMRLTVERRGEPENVDLDVRTAAAVTAYVARRRRGPLFLGESATARTATRLTRFGADFIIKRAADDAGLDRTVSANVLRRSFRAHHAEADG